MIHTNLGRILTDVRNARALLFMAVSIDISNHRGTWQGAYRCEDVKERSKARQKIIVELADRASLRRESSTPATRDNALTRRILSCPSRDTSIIHHYITTMSCRSVTLPLRLVSSVTAQRSSWTCRRCLATQAAGIPLAIDEVVSTPILPSGLAATTSRSQYGDPRVSASSRKDPTTGRIQTLSRTDRLLKVPLPHPVPEQHLQHTTADYLPEEQLWARSRTRPHKKIVGVVVSAGKMDKTVKVRVAGQRWEPRIRKVRARLERTRPI